MKQLQQGDVTFNRVNEVPNGAKKVKRDKCGYIMAEGEQTGHAHIIDAPIGFFEKDGVLFVDTKESVEVKHEEHGAVTLEPGIWQIGQVREWDYLAEMERTVVD